MKHKTLFFVILFAAIAAVSGAYYALSGGGAGVTANVYVDGELVETFDLTAAVVPCEVTVTTDYGTNVVRVSHGAVEVASADCDEQVCVNQGAIHDSLLPIVCLPHHLVIEIEE